MQGDFQNFTTVNKTRVSMCVRACVCIEGAGGGGEILVNLGQLCLCAMSSTSSSVTHHCWLIFNLSAEGYFPLEISYNIIPNAYFFCSFHIFFRLTVI